jgi:excinuclease ABC subunit A
LRRFGQQAPRTFRGKEAVLMDHLTVRGATQHNLKHVDCDLPRDKLVVITGPSGSGKSSLAFDTIYAEGQRRYVESLSAYARQFLDQLPKPAVESIEGLSPAIAIEQRALGKSPRSTVGTVTEIADYLRLLFARVGVPHCPKSGQVLRAYTVQEIVDFIADRGEGSRLTLLAPVVRNRKGDLRQEIEGLRRDGFVRARIDGQQFDLADESSYARAPRAESRTRWNLRSSLATAPCSSIQATENLRWS